VYTPASLLYSLEVMDPRVRDILLFCAGLAVVLCAALGSFAMVHSRAAGGGVG